MTILTWFAGHNGTSNHTNALELYAPGKENTYPMYPKTPSDEYNSYGTYEKNMDNLSDDFRNYEVCRVYDKPPMFPYCESSCSKLWLHVLIEVRSMVIKLIYKMKIGIERVILLHLLCGNCC